MASSSKLVVTLGLLLILITLGSADVFFVEGLPSPPTEEEEPEVTTEEEEPEEEPATSEGVKKKTDPDVESILSSLKFTIAEEVEEEGLLKQVIPQEEAQVETLVLLKEDDRAGMISWVTTPLVKSYFLSLKEVLHSSFSPEVRDLVDEVQRREGKPPRDFLTFLDPTISEERIVFVRIRERLYEIRIAEGKDDDMFALIEALTN